MVKSISLFLAAIFVSQLSFGKSVDMQSAKTTGANFLATQGIQAEPSAMSLIYQATSVVNGTQVTDFYVFSAGAAGFVIVAGDDNVIPVLGFSGESQFRASSIPASVSSWFTTYQNEINYVIQNNVQASEAVSTEWISLNSTGRKSAYKLADSVVTPLLKTQWDQTPYYNYTCPWDASADTNALTGCVATAMAQVMRYWSWPAKGTGSNSYSSPYGMLSATFSSDAYTWDSMPNMIYSNNKYVAKIMLDAGVSVNMDYGVTESGSFVTIASSPVRNCAEYAMVTYFNYKSSLQGVSRTSYTDADWVTLIETEIEAKRPVIYTGDGSSGGHCFVADGYTTGSRIHINWGWGGLYNGYYVTTNLAPGSTTFNSNQTLIVGITPNNPKALSVNQVAADVINIYPNPAASVINIDLQGTTATQVRLTDMEGRSLNVVTPAANAASIAIPVADLADGMYLVSVQTATGTITRKVAVAK